MKKNKILNMINMILVALCLFVGIAFVLGLSELNVSTAIGTLFILLASILFDREVN